MVALLIGKRGEHQVNKELGEGEVFHKLSLEIGKGIYRYKMNCFII